MPNGTDVTPAPEARSETLVPAADTAPDDQALQFVFRRIVADCRNEADKYLEEVRVAVGGE
jgi:hypothetical protein